jgi:hypothetical protein
MREFLERSRTQAGWRASGRSGDSFEFGSGRSRIGKGTRHQRPRSGGLPVWSDPIRRSASSGRGTTKRRDDEMFPRSICMSNEATVNEHSLESFFLSPYTRKYTGSWAPHGLGPRRLSMVAMGQRRPWFSANIKKWIANLL